MSGAFSTYGRRRETLEAMYTTLFGYFGSSSWWPAKSPFEVALGAILTQNTAWTNVEKALASLDAVTGLIPDAVAALSPEVLEKTITPAGFFRQKTIKIYNFLNLLREHGNLGHGKDDVTLASFAVYETRELREMLLAVSGIGPETADSILLYALNRPVFVVDAYTRRICARHGLVPDTVDYSELQEFFMDALPCESALFNEYHALLVRTGKEFCCKTKPRCDICPLGAVLEHAPE